MPQVKKSESFIIDTYKGSTDGKFIPGAIVFSGRKRMETLQWKDEACATQEEANEAVRRHFAGSDINEVQNEESLRPAS